MMNLLHQVWFHCEIYLIQNLKNYQITIFRNLPTKYLLFIISIYNCKIKILLNLNHLTAVINLTHIIKL